MDMLTSVSVLEIPKENFYFKVLQVSCDAGRETIKAQYKRLARQLHPDKNRHTQHQANESFKTLSEAYSVLRDRRKRKVYICGGKEALQQLQALDDSTVKFSDWFQQLYQQRVAELQPNPNIKVEAEEAAEPEKESRKRSFDESSRGQTETEKEPECIAKTAKYSHDESENARDFESAPHQSPGHEHGQQTFPSSSPSEQEAAPENEEIILTEKLRRDIKKKQSLLAAKHKLIKKEREQLEQEQTRFLEEKKAFELEKQNLENERRESAAIKARLGEKEDQITMKRDQLNKDSQDFLELQHDWSYFVQYDRKQLSKCLVLYEANWQLKKCLLCHEELKNEDEVKAHLEKHGDNFFTCPICFHSTSDLYILNSIQDLIAHLQSQHQYMTNFPIRNFDHFQFQHPSLVAPP